MISRERRNLSMARPEKYLEQDAERRQTFLELHEDFVQISNNYNTKDVKNTINAMEWFD